MNILFIGQYRDKGLDGKISRDYLRCLLKSEHNIQAIPLYIGDTLSVATDEINRAEKNKFEKKPDLVIQSCPPKFFNKLNVPSIGIYSMGQLEFSDVVAEKCRLVNCLIVPTITELSNIYDLDLLPNVYHIYPPVDMFDPDAITIQQVSEINTTINFYFVDEYSERSNLLGLVKAFTNEFTWKDKARLIIYSWVEGLDPNDSVKKILSDIEDLKKRDARYLKNKNYVSDLVITPNLSRESLLGLQKQCHCLVIPNRESFVAQQAIDALTFGNQILCTKDIGIESVLKNNAEYINSKKTYSNNNSNIPCGRFWHDPDLLNLSYKMREMYNNISSGFTTNENSRFCVYKDVEIQQGIAKLNNVINKVVS